MGKNYLSGGKQISSTLKWLKEDFKKEILIYLNSTDFKKRASIYGGEKIPENERNLTDSRGRVSLIIEYEFARAINDHFLNESQEDIFCSYVVANRFPDLEMRNSAGNLGLRFEVKCLQSSAEEKSANFSTLKKDLRQDTDFIIVFLWEWSDIKKEILWDRSPEILDMYIFSAYELAKLRDLNWLNHPPKTLGEGYQGFDIRYAVNCHENIYSEEEGNYGKLLRLWNKDLDYLKANPILKETELDYLSMKDDVVFKGFESIVFKILKEIESNSNILSLNSQNKKVGYKAGDKGFFFSNRAKNPLIREIAKKEKIKTFWVLSEKYKWSKFELLSDNVRKLGHGNKPKFIIKDHFSS